MTLRGYGLRHAWLRSQTHRISAKRLLLPLRTAEGSRPSVKRRGFSS